MPASLPWQRVRERVEFSIGIGEGSESEVVRANSTELPRIGQDGLDLVF
jgi:hypothetical protein